MAGSPMEGEAPPEPGIGNDIAAGTRLRLRLAGGSPSIPKPPTKHGSPEARPPFPDTARGTLALHRKTAD